MNFILKHKALAFVLLVFVFFHGFWISLYNDHIVDKFLVHTSRSVWVDVIVLMLIISAIWWTIEKLKNNFFLKWESLLIPGVALIGYLGVRLTNSEELLANWTFRNYKGLKEIRYFDIILVFCPIPFVLKFFGVKKPLGLAETNRLNLYTNDDPISSAEEDVLQLQQRSFQVYSMIKSCRNDKSIAIGIVGNWGQGKSSFMNLIEERFDDEQDYIVVHFNSWLNISARSIIHDFFNTIEEKVAPYGLDISNDIKKYGNKVLSVYKSTVAESILNGLNILNDSSLSNDYSELNVKLNVLNKRLLVFFDDLDRLQPNEVFEALKLIRNTASFDICNYIVGYDRKYINDALQKCGIPNAEKYCEKIFLKEFPLLPITETQILGFLCKAFIASLPNSEVAISIFFKQINDNFRRKKKNPFVSLRNLRDAKRFVNEVIISIQEIENEVEVSEFILVKLLKFSYYDVYRLLYDREKFIDASNVDYKVRRDDRPGKLKLRPVQGKVLLSSKFSGSLLEKKIIELGLYVASLDDIDTIVTKIFNVGMLRDDFSMVSLCYGMNYYKYFIDEIDPELFTKSEFDAFIKANSELKMNIVDNAFSSKKLEGLVHYIYRFRYADELISQDHYKSFVHILFYIARLPIGNSRSDYFGINKEFFYDVLTNNHCIETLFSDKYEFDSFVLDKFGNNLYPPMKPSEFEPDFLRHHYEKRNVPNLPYSRIEYEEYLERFMNLKMELVNRVDNEFWYCYKLCFTKTFTLSTLGSTFRGPKVLKKNKEKFVYELLPKFLDEFLVDSIHVKFEEETESKYYNFSKSNEMILLFEGYDNFKTYLNSFETNERLSKFRSEFLNEFIEFYEQNTVASRGIEFDFQYIPMRDKFDNSEV